MNAYGGGGLQWSKLYPGCFMPRLKSQYPKNRRLGRPHSQSGHFGEGKNLPGFESPQSAITTLSQTLKLKLLQKQYLHFLTVTPATAQITFQTASVRERKSCSEKYKATRGSKGTAQDGVEWTDLWSGSRSPGERVLDTQRIRGRMGPRANLDILDKNLLTLQGI